MPGAGQDRHQFGLVFKLQENFPKTALSNERRESLGNTGKDVHETQFTDAHLCPGPQCLSIVQLSASGSHVARLGCGVVHCDWGGLGVSPEGGLRAGAGCPGRR